ncbi:MAG: phosphoribosylformylglycinamidine synthase subunit PurL [archaeon]
MSQDQEGHSSSHVTCQIELLRSSFDKLTAISSELGLALTLEEMKSLQYHFTRSGRNPTDVELQTFGQTWSEHCLHKTFKGRVITPKGKTLANNLLKTYISRPAVRLKRKWCLDTFRDNAGIVLFEKRRGVTYGIAAKVETHNHPSAIEPFGGAATGVGGVIRDLLGVWAKPIACTDVLCFGPLDFDSEKLPQGINHPNYIFDGVVAGIGTYANNMGIPTVNGAIFFDESYVGNVVVYCGCIGLVPMNRFVRRTRPGDIPVLVGGRTGRDGIHGVTFASAELTEESQTTSLSAVQVPNPFEEEKLKRAVLEVRDRVLASAITDLGGGGLSCAIGEMASRSHCGSRVRIESVPLKETNPPMVPWEIWISESQERMLLSVPKKNLDNVLDIFESEEVLATPLGEFTDGKRLRAFYNGETVVDLDLDFLFHPPETVRTAEINEPQSSEASLSETVDLQEQVLKILSAPNIASKESVIRTYDHEVQGNTVIKPLQGKFAGPNDAAVLKPLPDSWKGIVVSCGMNPEYGKIDPYWMAGSAIDEAIRNNVAVGGRRIALLDNFTWGNPEKPDRMGTLLRACQGCYDFAMAFGTPFVSGKDSLYNESPLGPVTPTLLITAVGIISDVRKAVSMELKEPGNLLYLVGTTYPEIGGSQYLLSNGVAGGRVPQVRPQGARRAMRVVTAAIGRGYVRSCHDLSEGGLAIGAAEMAMGGGLGLDLRLHQVPSSEALRDDIILFSESNSRFLVEIEPENKKWFEKTARSISCRHVGTVSESDCLSIKLKRGRLMFDLEELREAWKRPFGM